MDMLGYGNLPKFLGSLAKLRMGARFSESVMGQRSARAMFGTFEHRNPVVVAFPLVVKFTMQFVLVYPLLAVTAMPLQIYMARAIKTNTPPEYEAHFLDCPLLLVAGFVFGMSAAKVWPTLTRSGRWIWTVPVFSLLAELLIEALRPPPYNRFPSEAFYSGANEGLTVFLITLPAFAYSGYSLAMFFARPGAKIR
jgi:hypothetical protein